MPPSGISVTRALLWGGEAPPYLCLAPRGGSGGLGPLRNLRYPCLASAAAVPCPQFFFVQIFSSEFFRRNFFVGFFSSEFFCRNFFVGIFSSEVFSSVVGPSSVRPSSVRPGILSWVYFSSAVTQDIEVGPPHLDYTLWVAMMGSKLCLRSNALIHN